MNKFWLILSMIVLITPLFAFPQTEETARLITENFLNILNDDFQIDTSYIVRDREENIYYVFNLNPQGFVAVSADDDITPVVAYSFHQNLENDQLDENLLHVMLASDLEMRLSYYAENPAAAADNRLLWQNLLNGSYRDNLRFQQWPSPGSTFTDGWVETQWNQSGVYNQMCPLDNTGSRSVAGCVATAMAMIMDYHEYIGNPVFTDADDYISGWWNPIYIDNDWATRDFPPFPELNTYLQDVAAHYAAGIDLTATDKAALNFACGVSVEMNYSSTGSGAWTEDVAFALLNKFGYDSAQYIENNGNSFYNVLINNMQSMRPVELTIYQSGFEGGHAIICDGYNTNDFYHLNFGWGTSNNACWYTLPAGMPSGYCIVTGAVVNIEGGDVPVAVQGNVNVGGVSPEGTYITFDGPRFYECFIDDAGGNFEIPAMTAGIYTVTALLAGRAYFQVLENVLIDENNHFVQINLGEFAFFTGHINAPVNAANTTITFYKNGTIAHIGIADANGDYSIPDVLPGSYSVTASLADNYFQAKTVVVSLDDQTEDFELAEYAGNMSVSPAGTPAGIWNLIPNYTIGCAVKLASDDLADFENDIISGVRFKAPVDDTQGSIFAQIWQGNVLLSETAITGFSAGEWLDVILNSFVPILPDQEFFVGYKITSATGAIAYRDAGPRVSGKGAFFYNGNWNQLAANNDFNFCIEAIVITQECGSISGTVELNGGNGNILDAMVKAGNYVTHPAADGSYLISLKAGIYDLAAELIDFSMAQIEDVVVLEDQITENQNFVLICQVGTMDSPIISDSRISGIFPNPFNPETTITFVTTENTVSTMLSIYNLKGQKVKTLVNAQLPIGEHKVVWNGTDETGKNITSGMYFADLRVDGRFTSVKKIILLK